MVEHKLKYQGISKKISNRYILTIVSIIIIVVISQLIMVNQTNQVKQLTEVTNISGRQSTLSQQITKDALALYLSEEKTEIDRYLKEIKTSAVQWESSHCNLKSGYSVKGRKTDNSNEIMRHYKMIEEPYQLMREAITSIIRMIEDGNYSKSILLDKVNILKRAEEEYRIGMEDIVAHYDQECKENLTLLGITDILLMIVFFIIVLLMTLYVFIPAKRNFQRAYAEINEGSKNLMQLFKTVHGAMFLLEEETLQVLLMNKEAEELVLTKELLETNVKIDELIQCNNLNCDVMKEKIKNNDKNENFELELNVKNNKKIYALMSSIKMTFDNKATILLSIFDITNQKHAEEILKNQVYIDQLTGLFNRYFLDKRIKEEMERADRDNKPVSIILLDLDRFKKVNDTWGHPMGDKVLIQTAQIAGANIRLSDILFRMGGEEFLIVLPLTDINGAKIVAEKIRKAFDDNVHPVVGRYTASFGVAEKRKSEEFLNWYKRVDEALYHAKEGGRNCVVSAEETEMTMVASVHLLWKDEWTSGNEKIDSQHKELLRIANSLISLSLSSAGEAKITPVLEKLVDHIKVHFADEEEILKNIGYNDYEMHTLVHKSLVDKVLELRRSYQNGKLKPSAFFAYIIDDVVVGHIQEVDTQYFPFMENINKC